MLVSIHNDMFTQDLEESRRHAIRDEPVAVEGMALPLPEDEEDILQYKFNMFADTYFNPAAVHTYSNKVLKQPLLNLKNEGDQLV